MNIKPVDPMLETIISSQSLQDKNKPSVDNQQHKSSAEVKDQVSVDSNSICCSLKFMSNLRAVSDEINAYAKVVRHTDVVLEKAGKQVELMKKPLEAIIKNFPPFPPGSEQRAELLKSYISLRKEIDKLTVPPPLDVSTPALQQMFDDMFDKDGKFKVGDTLELPEAISPEATDHQIISVIDKLDTAKMQIDRGRVELSSSVK